MVEQVQASEQSDQLIRDVLAGAEAAILAELLAEFEANDKAAMDEYWKAASLWYKDKHFTESDVWGQAAFAIRKRIKELEAAGAS